MRQILRLGWLLPLLITAAMFSLSNKGGWAKATTGSIYGRITDASQAVVQAAEVAAENERTGISYRGSSDNLGNFSIFGLPPGPYTVVVKKVGFETSRAKNVRIEIDQKQLLNFELKVGTSATEVTVTTAPSMLQTESAETGDVIRSNDILDLPLNERHFYDLTG